MGCDIHACIEYTDWTGLCHPEEPRVWFVWSDFELNIGRCYRCFAALSGVRRQENDPFPLFQPRGFPCEVAVQQRYQGYMNGAYHSHSYLEYGEILQAIKHFGLDLGLLPIQFKAAIAAMAVLSREFETRLVFCFDS